MDIITVNASLEYVVSLKQKIFLHFLVPILLLLTTGIIILTYLHINGIFCSHENLLLYFAVIFAVAAIAFLLFAIYASNRISDPILKNAELAHRMVFPKQADDTWGEQSSFD